jgi:hypothetical protein
LSGDKTLALGTTTELSDRAWFLKEIQALERIWLMYRILLIILAGSLLLSGPAFAKANWPQFHGPSAGVAEDGVLPASWSTTENVA